MSRFLMNGSLWRSRLLVRLDPAGFLAHKMALFHAGAPLWQVKIEQLEEDDNDKFGVGSKFAKLDSASGKKKDDSPAAFGKRFDFQGPKFSAKSSSLAGEEDESDQFGTLTREHEQMEEHLPSSALGHFYGSTV